MLLQYHLYSVPPRVFANDNVMVSTDVLRIKRLIGGWILEDPVRMNASLVCKGIVTHDRLPRGNGTV